MDNAHLAGLIQETAPEAVLEARTDHDDLRITTAIDHLVPLLANLLNNPELAFELLSDIVAVDYPERSPRFDLDYILYSVKNEKRLIVNLQVDEGREVPTASHIFASADWAEREVFDLMGIGFSGHPDLRRILTWDNFEGHPLRKDFPIRGEGFDQPFDPDSVQVKSAFSDQELTEAAEGENKTVILNMGPHHPATHGVLRLELEIEGETIKRAKPHVGYL
ncbi:MAG: NADH-quinone oxidoreductase subunit C, partial [Thermodesulfobacteriota bacterium]